MPYVPTADRPNIDFAVEVTASELASKIENNFSILDLYRELFDRIGNDICYATRRQCSSPNLHPLVGAILAAGSQYGYEGAFLGELNYAITRLIQRVPQIMVREKRWAAKDELRYWLYACTVEALVYASNEFLGSGVGVAGVFEDIKDEYKRRVNTGYEAAQIIKSGDCYDTPYYNRLMRIVDADGNEIGKILVDMPRSDFTLKTDILDFNITATPATT